MLTPRQRECLDFIEAFIARERRGPLYHEIATGLGLKSRGAAVKHVHALMKRGFVNRASSGKGHLALTGKCVEPMRDDLPSVRLAPAQAAEIDALVQSRNLPSREAALHWLVEFALHIHTVGSLPGFDVRHAAPFQARAGRE